MEFTKEMLEIFPDIYQEEYNLPAQVLDADNGTQNRTFYIKTGNDTNDNSYKQLYNRVVEKLSHLLLN